MAHDIIIRGGTVVDGTGGRPRTADVAVDGGSITAVGDVAATARETIDAAGCIVTPGFVDPHTHLDAQLCWDSSASPSNLHGVTTVLMGMCGFGVAPVTPLGGDYLLRTLEVVEEIPHATTTLGVPFGWRTYGDFLDYVAGESRGVNVGGLVPHSALRYYVMGDRGRFAAATDDERRRLVRELESSLAAGALGFSSSRGPNHRDASRRPVPSLRADNTELQALVSACSERIWQINLGTKTSADAAPMIDEVDLYAEWTQRAGARLTWSPLTADVDDLRWHEITSHHRELNRATTVAPQVVPSPITATLTFDRPSALKYVSGWRDAVFGLFDLAPDARRARVSDQSFREQAGSNDSGKVGPLTPQYDEWVLCLSRSRPDLVGTSVATAAEEAGQRPVDLLCDLLVADDLTTQVSVAIRNRDTAGVAQLILDPHTLVGLGDAGAHVRSITTFTYPTYLLSTFVRDRRLIPLEIAVERMSRRPCELFGIKSRGIVAAGYAADLCVIDLDRLALRPLTVTYDLPGGAARLYQGATGYEAVLVNGCPTIRNDEPTGSAPGRVLRNDQGGPTRQ